MKTTRFFPILVALCLLGCKPSTPVTPDPKPEDTTAHPVDTTTQPVDTVTPIDSTNMIALRSSLTHVQPMTGLVLWPAQARSKSAHSEAISMEFSYCLPCKVVTGKQNGVVQYDWTSFDNLLNDISSRGHQAIVRFRYEYPNSSEVNGTKGATAVPAYIKELPDYEETYSSNPGGDGPTYYADWSNAELQWFTKQFYTDFAARYGSDSRIAFLEVGFGHWSEYHIYGTQLRLGTNFPSKAYQSEFLQHVANVMPIPWLVSIDAADDTYSPIVGSSTLMALTFGLFDDSFMHEGHEIGSSDGYNEENWNAIGKGKRWKTGVCGGEVSYYTSRDQREFLKPSGLYGHTWEEQAAKYHISFMIANDAPGSTYGTAERFREAGLASGYHLKVVKGERKPASTVLYVTNTGVAPLYRDAYFAIGDTRAAESLNGLLPGDTLTLHIAVPLADAASLRVVSDFILPDQTIEYEADIRL